MKFKDTNTLILNFTVSLCLLILCLNAEIFAANDLSEELSARYVPNRNYDLRNVALDLRFDREAEQTFGTATLTFAPLLVNTRKVTFNAAKMQFNSVKLQSSALLKFSYDEPKELLTVELDRNYQPSDILTVIP